MLNIATCYLGSSTTEALLLSLEDVELVSATFHA